METMHRIQREATEQTERLLQWMLFDDPMPVTSDILERTRRWNSLKSMNEKTGCINRKMTENAGREFYPSPGVACSTDAARRQLLYFLRRHKFISNLNYCLNVNWMPWIRSQLFSQAVDCIFYCIGTEISF